MKSLTKILMLLTLGLVQQSCFFQKEEEPTLVKGVITNQVTGEAIVGVPVEVRECAGGFNLGSRCDSFKTVFTDAAGAYELAFTSKKNRFYNLGIGNNDSYVSAHHLIDDYGLTLEKGKINEVNLTTVPYQILQVDIETSKQGKNFLEIRFETADSEGNWLAGQLLLDTARQNTSLNTTRYAKVFPQRQYKLTKRLCNRTGLMSSGYSFSDCEVTTIPAFYFGYTDTVRVKLE